MEERTAQFMDMKLIPGQVLQLEFEGYTSIRERSVLVGYRRNGSVIVSTPLINGVLANVKAGEQINVRFFAGKMSSACAFTTEVLTSSKSPYAHIHLKIPDAVMVGEVRQSVRADVEVVTKIKYTLKGESKGTTAKIVDLSMNGARILGRTFDFETGVEVMLVFLLEVTGIQYEISVKSIVRSIAEIEKGYAVGLQFVDVPPSDQIALQAFVLSKVHDL